MPTSLLAWRGCAPCAAGRCRGRPADDAGEYLRDARQGGDPDRSTNRDQVLFAKNPDEPLPPASMSKLMTVYMVFERLKDGRLSLDDDLPGQREGVAHGRLEDVRRGRRAGPGRGPAARHHHPVRQRRLHRDRRGARPAPRKPSPSMMTERGARTRPDQHYDLQERERLARPGHLMTVRDLASLAQHRDQRFPEYYPIFSEKEFTFSGIRQYSRNPLLHRRRRRRWSEDRVHR